MRPRLLGLAALFAMLFVSTSAFAARPAPEVEVLLPGPFESITPGPPLPNGACVMGVSEGATFLVNYLLPPDDAYYTALDPANCACPNGSIQINAAHVALNFRVVCAQPVTVSIVGSIDNAGCAVPNPDDVLCEPIAYNLAPGATGNFVFNLPIPEGCCITGKAFLVINFIAPGVGCSTSTTRPRLITDATCEGCTSYNIYPGGQDELCGIGFPGNPLMWADGDCCSVTPAGNASWGSVKSMYR
jgi:hypothetical protein